MTPDRQPSADRLDESIQHVLANEHGGACYWDSAEGPADACIVARALIKALKDQADMTAVLRKISALGHALAGDTPIVPGSTTDVIDALLSRFPSEPA